MILTEKEQYIGNLIVVNAEHPYHEELSAPGLYPVCQDTPDILLEKNALRQLSGLMAEIGGREKIVPVSGWRSRKEQQSIFDTSMRENGEEFTRKFVALPGCSEHQTGLAIDLALKKEDVDFICPEFPRTGICRKFRERAASYGLIERYRKDKEKITGISGEPWHFRYVGRPHAEIMERYHLCLEEYSEMLKRFPYGRRYYCWNTEQGSVRISYLAAGADMTGFEAAYADAVGFKTAEGRYEISGNNMDGYIVTIWERPEMQNAQDRYFRL